MIKEKDLVPGRVISRFSLDDCWEPKVIAYLIIGFQANVKRRHAKSKARRDGWHVLLLSFGGELKDFIITPAGFYLWDRLI